MLMKLVYPLGYYARVTALNNLLVLSQQLQKNVQTSVSHKYIAHQLALLYVSVFMMIILQVLVP